MSARVLLLGSRAGAFRAAARLGLEVSLLATRPVDAATAARVARHAPLEPGMGVERVLEIGRELVGSRRIDAVIGLTEGTVELSAWLREALGAPGPSLATARRCTDKLAMKRAAAAAGVPTTDWEQVTPATRAEELVARLGLPLVMKPARSSGSRGLVMAHSVDEVRAGLARCELAERFVHGAEMSVELFFTEGALLFDNPTEYLVRLHANVVPAALEPRVWRDVRDLAERAARAMGLERGMAHVELFLTPDGPLFGEIAARPPGGRLMPLLQLAYDFDPYEALLRIERGERPELPRRAQRCAGVWILHPGAGTVRSVTGAEEAAALPCVTAVRCRARAGQRIARREGSGQDVGYIEAVGANRDEVAAALVRAHELLRIELE